MKKATLLFGLVYCFFYGNAQAPNWLWAKSAGGTGGDGGSRITTDGNGNIYATGDFSDSSIVFGSFTLTNTNKDTADFFIVKYDANGNVLWAKSAGGTQTDKGQSISTDANGNVYVIGNYESSSITFGSYTLVNKGNSWDIFAVKYDSNGNVLWAKSAGGTTWDWGNSLATDNNGNLYLTGYFTSPSIAFSNDTLPSGFFLIKFDSNGNELWGKSVGSYYDYGLDVTTDNNGNVYVSGTFWSTVIIFGIDTLQNTSGNQYDAFVVKYDSNGNVLWARSAGALYNDGGNGIMTDNTGNVYVTGYYSGSSIIFGSDTLQLTSYGYMYYDFFVVKYASNGNVLWAKSAGGPTGGMDYEVGYDISVDGGGNAYSTGHFTGPYIIFENDTLSNGINPGYFNVFTVKYDSSGNFIWSQCATSASGISGINNGGNGISTDNNGYTYITGSFLGPDIVFGNDTLLNAGYTDFFIAKLESSSPCNITLALSKTDATCTGCNDGTATVTPNGGTTPYTYLWNNSATTSAITGLFAGTYSVTVADAAACTKTDAIAVNQPGCNITLSLSKIDATCNGCNDGTASVIPSGGIAPYSYLWSNGKTTQTITGLLAGTYSVTVTDAAACTKSGSISVNQPGSTPSNIIVNNVILNNTAFLNPKLLWSGTTSQTASTIKICADASTATHISFVNNTGINSNNIKFWIASDPSGINSDVSGQFINYVVSGYTITAEYAHPKYLQSTYAPLRSDNIQIVDYTNSSPAIFTIPIEIYRAPVIMVHGLWGDYMSFLDMKNYLDASGYYPFGSINQSLLILNADYSATNANYFYDNRNVVPSNINTILNIARTQNFSAGKVDVIGHSMGGLLSRYYLQSPAYQQKKDIHKLITINTPHSGSQFGNLLTNTTNGAAIAAQAVAEPIANSCFNSSIYNGAVNDLAINSPAMNYLNTSTLNNGIVPTHAIITECTTVNDNAYYLMLAAAAPPIQMSTSAFFDYMFYNDPNDLVVSALSQSGGLPSSATNTLQNQMHIGSPANLNVMNEVINAINTNPADASYFAQSGFSPASLNSHFKLANDTSTFNLQSGSIAITYPAPNQNFNTGDLIPVNITSSNGINRTILQAINLQSNAFLKDTVLSNGIINYVVPANAFGKVKIIALGYDPNNLIDYDTLTINVNLTAALDSLKSYPDTIHVQVNNIAPINLVGYFSNGYSYNISHASGIQYQLANPGVASYYNSNLIRGNQIGITSVLATYLSYSKTIPVVVSPQDTTIHLSTGIDSPQTNNNSSIPLIIYPNPSIGTFTLEFEAAVTATIKVINVFGEIIYTTHFKNASRKEINLRNIATGIYFVQIKTGDKLLNKKIIIQ